MFLLIIPSIFICILHTNSSQINVERNTDSKFDNLVTSLHQNKLILLNTFLV